MVAVDGGDPKRARIASFSTTPTIPKRIDTHNDSFHCDESLDYFTIRLTDKFSGAEIVRSRYPKVMDILDAVLDVGGMHYGMELIIAKELQLGEGHEDVPRDNWDGCSIMCEVEEEKLTPI